MHIVLHNLEYRFFHMKKPLDYLVGNDEADLYQHQRHQYDLLQRKEVLE